MVFFVCASAMESACNLDSFGISEIKDQWFGVLVGLLHRIVAAGSLPESTSFFLLNVPKSSFCLFE